MNATLNVVDFGFGALEKVSEFDAVELGEKVINASLVITATIHAVISYVVTALQLFWMDNGEVISKRAVQFVFLTVDFAGELLIAGRDFRKFVNFVTAQVTDRAFYAVCY